jgi:hypothetical protein
MYDPENKKTPTEVDVLNILVEHRGIEFTSLLKSLENEGR